MQRTKISQVFCLYPLKQEHMDLLLQWARDFIDWRFIQKLSEVGIRVSSLIRDPKSLRSYESFTREARQVKGNILLQCRGGRHASTAYAIYYIAKTTQLTYTDLIKILINSGFSGHDISLIEDIFRDAKINMRQLFEEKRLRVQPGKRMIRKQNNRKKERKQKFRKPRIF